MSEDQDRPRKRHSTRLGHEVRDKEVKLQFFYQGNIGTGKDSIKCPFMFPFRSRSAMAEWLGLTDAKLKGSTAVESGAMRLSQESLDTLSSRLGFADFLDSFISESDRAFATKYVERNTYVAPSSEAGPSSHQPKPAVVWNPPSTREQVLRRIEAWRIEDAAGVEVGSGYAPLASHRIKFVAVTDGSEELVPEAERPKTKLKFGEHSFAGVAFSGLKRNDTSFPWPLGLDLDLGTTDDGMYMEACIVELSFSGKASTVAVGDRKRRPGEPNVAISPEREAKRCGLRITPHGTGTQAAGWTVNMKKGPVGSLTLYDLIEVTMAEAGDTIDAVLILSLRGLAANSDR